MEQPDSPPRRVRKTKVKMKPPERCWSCRGLTYFSTAMRDQNKKPVCLGMSRTLASPPPPFLSMGEIDRAALEQVGEEEDSLWRETERTRPMDIYYLCFGTAVVTSKMKKDGGMPFCDRGQICTFAIPRSVEGEHAGDAQSEGNSRLPQVGLHNMPDSTEVMESVKARLVSVYNFWRKAPENYPERYVRFTKKLIRSMGTTTVNSAKFGKKMIMSWVDKKPSGPER